MKWRSLKQDANRKEEEGKRKRWDDLSLGLSYLCPTGHLDLGLVWQGEAATGLDSSMLWLGALCLPLGFPPAKSCLVAGGRRWLRPVWPWAQACGPLLGWPGWARTSPWTIFLPVGKDEIKALKCRFGYLHRQIQQTTLRQSKMYFANLHPMLYTVFSMCLWRFSFRMHSSILCIKQGSRKVLVWTWVTPH